MLIAGVVGGAVDWAGGGAGSSPAEDVTGGGEADVDGGVIAGGAETGEGGVDAVPESGAVGAEGTIAGAGGGTCAAT